MKVLFICAGNAARSQIAVAFFERFSKNKAFSAGVAPNPLNIGQPARKLVIKAMKKVGYDISRNKRKKLTKDMVNQADLVVVILTKAERKKYKMNYLKNSSKVIFWDIWDIAESGTNYNLHVKLRNRIKRRVKNLVKDIS